MLNREFEHIYTTVCIGSSKEKRRPTGPTHTAPVELDLTCSCEGIKTQGSDRLRSHGRALYIADRA
jgi:hypothetical protein